jgi:hypothetical protein
VLQKRRWLVLRSLAAVVLLVTAVSLFLPKRYEASSPLLLDLEGPDDLGLEQMVMPMGLDMNTKLETQIRIVQSDTIATSVIASGLAGRDHVAKHCSLSAVVDQWEEIYHSLLQRKSVHIPYAQFASRAKLGQNSNPHFCNLAAVLQFPQQRAWASMPRWL